MGRRLAEPDYAAALATLPAEDRATVARWCETMGAPLDTWHLIPPLRQLVVIVALLRLAADMPDLSRGDAFAEACAALGLEDDSDRSTRPSDSYVRSLNRWLGAAYAAGQDVQTARDDAA